MMIIGVVSPRGADNICSALVMGVTEQEMCHTACSVGKGCIGLWNSRFTQAVLKEVTWARGALK